jgi:hypothetical protein
VSKYDWVLLSGVIATTTTAWWYQIRYYRLVDDLFEFLTVAPPEEDE